MQAVSKLHAILSEFQDDRGSLRQGELARALGMSASALSRTLASFVEHGFLRHSEENGSYTLGPTVVSLAGAAINQYPEFRYAYPELHGLMAETSLGVNLALPTPNSVMYLMHLDGPLMKRGRSLIGRHVPLHATALGKVALAARSDDSIRESFDGAEALPAYTANTITNIDSLLIEVSDVRRRGYSIELEELALSRGCIAVAIRGRNKDVAATLSLSGPKDAIRLEENESKYANLLLDAADRVSSMLGYHQDSAVYA